MKVLLAVLKLLAAKSRKKHRRKRKRRIKRSLIRTRRMGSYEKKPCAALIAAAQGLYFD